MIGYVTLGTNDLARATGFYESLLGEIGAKRFMSGDSYVIWSCSPTTRSRRWPTSSTSSPWRGRGTGPSPSIP